MSCRNVMGATTSRTGPKDNTRISNSVSSSWSYRSVIRYSCSSSFCVSFSKWEKCNRTRSKPLRSSCRSKGVLQEVIANQLLPSFLQPRELLQLTGPIRKIGSKTKGNNNVVYSCKYHVVWCPKYRRKVLVNGVDVRLKALIEEVCNDYHIDIIEMEIMPDHVHLLMEVDPQFGIHKAVKQINLCPPPGPPLASTWASSPSLSPQTVWNTPTTNICRGLRRSLPASRGSFPESQRGATVGIRPGFRWQDCTNTLPTNDRIRSISCPRKSSARTTSSVLRIWPRKIWSKTTDWPSPFQMRFGASSGGNWSIRLSGTGSRWSR